MSYDIDAGAESHNYTYNMYQFFKDFDAYPPSWDGVDRYTVATRIDGALARIQARNVADLRARYDAPNGWGDVPTAIAFLERVRASCRQEIPSTVRVY